MDRCARAGRGDAGSGRDGRFGLVLSVRTLNNEGRGADKLPGGITVLQGTLDTLSLPELFDVLAATKKTGALHVRGTRGLGVVYCDAGLVCAAEAGAQSGPVEDEPAVVARLHDVCFELFRY